MAVPLFVASTVDAAFTVSVVPTATVAGTLKAPAALIVPPPDTVQVTVWAGLFVPATAALKAALAPCATLADAGVTVTLATVAVPLTVTAAVPLFPASTVEVAVTVRDVLLSPAATVRTPPELMLVPVLPSTDQLTLWEGLPVPATVALKDVVPPLAAVAVAGLTVTPVTVAAPLTATAAAPLFVSSTVEAAVTVRVVAVSSPATTKIPSALIRVPVLVPPDTDQVTVWAGLLSPSPVTVAVKA
jgi:hypothetical protein